MHVHLSLQTRICISRCGHIYRIYFLYMYVCVCMFLYIHMWLCTVPLNMPTCLCISTHTLLCWYACACVLSQQQQDDDQPSLDDSFHNGFNFLPRHTRYFSLPQVFLQCFSQALLILSNNTLSRFMLLNMASTQHILYWLFPKISPGSHRNHCVAPAWACTEESVTSR